MNRISIQRNKLLQALKDAFRPVSHNSAVDSILLEHEMTCKIQELHDFANKKIYSSFLRLVLEEKNE